MTSPIKVAINGFGRIGRMSFRAILNYPQIQVVAVNDLTDIETLAHLLRYDSVQGRLETPVTVSNGHIHCGQHIFKVYSEKDPSALPWGELGIDVVIESTGLYLDKASAGKHLEAGARKIIITAPAKEDVPTFVLGVNDHLLSTADSIVSNASCTTNCAAPMVKVLDEAFGVEWGLLSTVHAYTGDQRLVDAPHKDLRRARSAALSIIPTSTGAAKAIGLVMPHLKGKLDGTAFRVPVPSGSMTDFTVNLKKPADKKSINEAFYKASKEQLSKILEYTTDPIVSIDIIGNPHSCVFDSDLTLVMGNTVKVVGWYDNEAGYSARVSELVLKMCAL